MRRKEHLITLFGDTEEHKQALIKDFLHCLWTANGMEGQDPSLTLATKGFVLPVSIQPWSHQSRLDAPPAVDRPRTWSNERVQPSADNQKEPASPVLSQSVDPIRPRRGTGFSLHRTQNKNEVVEVPVVEGPLNEVGRPVEGNLDAARLTFSSRIACGGFGEVWRGEYDGQLVAIKVGLNKIDQDWFHRELELTHQCQGAYVVALRGSCVTPKYGPCIVLEYAVCDLKSHLLARRPERERRLEIALQIAEAVEFLHSRNPVVIHRDLKPANILVFPNGAIKLADFGIGRSLNHSDDTNLTITGTLHYMAPELRKALAEGQAQIRGTGYESVDIFSFGRVLMDIFPFELVDKLPLADLITRCTGDNPILRPTAAWVKQTLYGVVIQEQHLFLNRTIG